MSSVGGGDEGRGGGPPGGAGAGTRGVEDRGTGGGVKEAEEGHEICKDPGGKGISSGEGGGGKWECPQQPVSRNP